MKTMTTKIAKMVATVTMTLSAAGIAGGLMTGNVKVAVASALFIMINVGLLLQNRLTANEEV